MIRILVLTLCFLSVCLEGTFPLAYNGRFRPFEAYTRLRLAELYSDQSIKPADQALFQTGSQEEWVWNFHFNGHSAYDQAPLFFIHSADLKKALGLDTKKNRFSYAELNEALAVNRESNLRLMQALIPAYYWKAYNDPSNKGRKTTLSLPALSSELWLSLEGEMLEVISTPKNAPWHHLKVGQQLNAYSPLLEEFPELRTKMDRYVKSEDAFLALPTKSVAGQWVSLQALSDSSNHNFTPYPDSLFLEIKRAYKERDIPLLKKKLEEGYATIAGSVYLKSEGKSLYYPTSWQLIIEAWLFTFPWLYLCIAFYTGAILGALVRWNRTAFCSFILAFILHSLVLALRCYILQRPPVSNMFETIIYVPWIAVLGSLLLKKMWAMVASSVVAVMLLVLLKASQLQGNLENVQAVLDSQYWLTIHVLMVVGSYGFFALAGVLGHIYLVDSIRRKSEHASLNSLASMILQSLYFGTALLIPGTILGGVWAAQSWGRFWDWDPKESWAFISGCVYLIVIHAYRFSLIRDFGLAVGAIAGFCAISFTWYGVNYILGTGLHSYGFGNGGEIFYYAYLAAEFLFIGAIWMCTKMQIKQNLS